MKKQIKDYVEVETSYCHYLSEKLNKIRYVCFSKTTSIEDCKRVIGGIMKPAKWTSKKVWFNKTMNSIEDKKQLYFLVYNSVNKARDTIVRTN